MSALRRRANKGGIPEKLLAAQSPEHKKQAPEEYAGVPQNDNATWTERHQWGLVPLMLTLFARA